MNESHLQLNLYSRNCRNAFVLYVCMQLFLERVSQRVDCVAPFSGYHLAFCCLLNGKRQEAGQGVHGNEATETVCN